MQKIILSTILLSNIFIAGCTSINNESNLSGSVQIIQELSSENTSGDILSGEISSGVKIIHELSQTGSSTGIISQSGLSQSELSSGNISSGITINSGTDKQLLEMKLRAMIERRNKEMQQETIQNGSKNSGEITEEDIEFMQNIIDQIASGSKKK